MAIDLDPALVEKATVVAWSHVVALAFGKWRCECATTDGFPSRLEALRHQVDAALAAVHDDIAAKALRDAAREVYGDERAKGPHSHPLSIASWLRDRADALDGGGS